jgi:hypothetical protein
VASLKNIIPVFYLILAGLCVHSSSLHGQQLVPDTLYLDFRGDSILPLHNVGIRQVKDLRGEHSHFLGMTTRRAWLLIPVDREIHCKQPLNLAIKQHIPETSPSGREYYIDIGKFEIIEKSRRFSKEKTLVADLYLYKQESDSLRKMGILYYDRPYQAKRRGESYAESCENLLHDWHTDFKLDLLTLPAAGAGLNTELTPNFIADPNVKSLYLNAKTGAFAGFNWYGFQAEIFFSRPETKATDRYSAGIVRYINNRDYESFAIGRQADHHYWRRNESWLLDIDANILMGFCKWKDIEGSAPTLYQLFDFSLSSVQSAIYNPINTNSLTLRLGVIENLSYIILDKIRFHVGLFAELGFKF